LLINKKIMEKTRLARLEKSIKEVLVKLDRNYPDHAKGSIEYNRVINSLENFLVWGYWERHVDSYYSQLEKEIL